MNQCKQSIVPFFYKQGISDTGFFGAMPTLGGKVFNEVPWGEK
jgi:hypothetical protein